MRNTITLTLALLLALALSLESQRGNAGVCGDGDGDGVGGCAPGTDNCAIYPNGPLAQDPSTPACDAQEDGDMDGYGNPCDADVDNDGAASLVDVSMVLAAAVLVSTNLNTDLDCDGAASLVDVSRALAAAAVVQTPGPSEYTCAGSIPCP